MQGRQNIFYTFAKTIKQAFFCLVNSLSLYKSAERLKKNGIYWIGFLLILIIAAGCSTKKNTAGSRFYHSFTTRFNVFFNGSEAFKAGAKAIEDGNKDNYMEMIPLYPIGNKKTAGIGAGDFDRAIEKSQKAIKQHSIKKKPPRKPGQSKSPKFKKWLAQKEYNPFLWRAWMLMGQAQFNKGEFLEAESTFAYIARLYETNPNVSALARIWMAECYSQLDWFYDAEDALTKVNSDSLPNELAPQYAAAHGNYLLRQKKFKEAVPYLITTIKHEKRKKQRAREHYLLGQVYQSIGDQPKAYAAYGKCIKQNPPYELEFNAQIKQTEVMQGKSTEKIVKKLHRMARDQKNKEYLDQIYYASGNVYLAKKDTANAIAQYKLGAEKSTRNGMEKGILLLTMGDLYWAQANYPEAQKCYSEALGLIDKEYPAYAELNKRSEILDELVGFAVNVQLQDSLQHLATLPEADQLKIIDKIIEEVKKKEEEERKAAEREELMNKREEAMADQPFANRNTKAPTAPAINSGDKSWYFYNQQLISQGKTDFQRKWGRRKLEDNWRRRNKTVVTFDDFAETKYDDEGAVPADSLVQDSIATAQAKLDSIASDNKNPQFYLQQIPTTPEAIAESNDIIKDGLFNMGMIYKDKLEDFPLAEKTFTRLYSQFPGYENLDQVYYNLYLMNSRWKHLAEATNYKNILITRFPESKYAVTLSDPDYLDNILHGKHREDSLYASTYAAWTEGDFSQVINNYQTATRKYAMGQHLPKFMFLNAMSLLQQGNQKEFLTALKELVQKYPENEITELAAYIIKGMQEGRLLASDGSAFGSIWKRRKSDMDAEALPADSLMPKFSTDKNIPFIFLLAYEDGKVNENLLLYEMARYNFSNFIVKNFDLSFVKENGIGMLETKEFTNFEEAHQYLQLLYKDKEMARKLNGLRAIIISEANFDLLRKYYSFDDYDSFYQENFSAVPEYREDEKTLDEPLMFQGVDQVEEEDY